MMHYAETLVSTATIKMRKASPFILGAGGQVHRYVPRYYVSESTVFRLLKAQDLIASPVFIVLQAADRFRHPTTRVNQLWQTDSTCLKVIGWGWFYLSTVLDDCWRFILAWRLCTGMAASDVSATLEQALALAGLYQAKVVHRPRVLSDNGPSYVSRSSRRGLKARAMAHTRGKPYHESLNNLAPADVYYGRGTNILRIRREIKQQTLNERRRLHRQNKVA